MRPETKSITITRGDPELARALTAPPFGYVFQAVVRSRPDGTPDGTPDANGGCTTIVYIRDPTVLLDEK